MQEITAFQRGAVNPVAEKSWDQALYGRAVPEKNTHGEIPQHKQVNHLSSHMRFLCS